MSWKDKNCNWSQLALCLNPEFGVNHYFQHPLEFRKFALELQPWLLFSKQNDKIPRRGNYEFLLNHVRIKRAWQFFFLSFFTALNYVQFLHSDRSVFPAAGAIPWPTSSCWNSDTDGSSLGLMWSWSAWKNEVWWPLSESTYWKEGRY